MKTVPKLRTRSLGGVDLADPLHPVKVPWPAGALAAARNFTYRALPMRWAMALATATTRLDMMRRPDRRRELLSVLRTVVPEQTDERVLRQQLVRARAIRKLGGNTYAAVFRRSRPWLLKNLRPEGLEHLDALHAAGGGAVILATHVGQNGWVGPVLRQLGYPLRLMQRRRTTVDAYMLLRRDGFLRHVLPFPSPAESGLHLKRLHDMLRGGAWIQHVGDFPATEGGLCGTYMGRAVQCVPGPWVLARLARVPVVPVLLLVDGRGKGRLHVCPPIRVEPAASLREGLEELFQTYLDFVSARLRPAPWNVGLKHWQKLFARDWPEGPFAWG